MSRQAKLAEKMKETFGGYMSVDRVEALKYNWDTIQKLTLPRYTEKAMGNLKKEGYQTPVFPKSSGTQENKFSVETTTKPFHDK